jgi:uncharacterized protein YciI
MTSPLDKICYAVILLPIGLAALTSDVIARHAEHLQELDEAGKLLLAGPFIDHPTGMLVLQVASKAEVKLLMDEDPLIREGFKNYEIRTWLMANKNNNYLP